MNKIDAVESKTYIPPEVFQQYGVYTEVPVENLWYTKPITGFHRRSLEGIIVALNQQGLQFLRDHPICAILVPYPTDTIIAIDDGHHRSRLGPKFGIRNIPSLVVDIATATKALGRDEAKERLRFEVEMSEAVISMANRFGPGKNLMVERIPTALRNAQDLIQWLQTERKVPQSAA